MAGGKVVGAVLVGAADDADLIIQAVVQREPVSVLSELLLKGHWRKRSRALAA